MGADNNGDKKATTGPVRDGKLTIISWAYAPTAGILSATRSLPDNLARTKDSTEARRENGSTLLLHLAIFPSLVRGILATLRSG